MKTTRRWANEMEKGSGRPIGAGAVWLVVLVGTLGFLVPRPVYSQGVVVGSRVCPPAQVSGTLGITSLDCVGECSITLSDEGKEEAWSFSAEPRVLRIEPGSAVDGLLQEGDFLVALNGILITTRDGGRRFADMEPGERVRISYRRDGAVREAMVEVGAKCAEPVPLPETGRVAPPPPQPSEPHRVAVTAPRIRVTSPTPPDSARVPRLGGSLGIALGRSMDPQPRGRLGLGFSCSQCGTSAREPGGKEIWFFSGPIEVTQVNSGGPAERAGIRIGDFITAIDGKDVTTEAGGEAFGSLVPGEPVRITLTRRSGREEAVTLIPGDPDEQAVVGVAVPSAPDSAVEPRRLGAAVRAPSDIAAPPEGRAVEAPAPPAVSEPLAEVFAGPEELPRSYYGNVEGVEVVVRGGPISVSELRGARTIIINSEGLWIRIRVPARIPRSGGGEGGGG